MTNPLPGPAPDTGTVDAENPWPGLAAFREADQAYFRGREQVADDLVRLILRARLSVLYGLSGLGKTSLLRAGVFPPLRHAGVLPVYIRLRHGDQGAELREQVWDAISASAEVAHVEAPPPGASETLWGYFFRKDVRFWNERNRIAWPGSPLGSQRHTLKFRGRRSSPCGTFSCTTTSGWTRTKSG